MLFSLLHPGLFLLGIASISIPVILHLLKRKRRPIPWGAMRFLEQAYRKRRRILTIEQLILLALRCLLLALIALGVGSLMLGSGLQKTLPTTMVIVIDISIGSALIDGEQSSLELNKAFALRAIDELDTERGDRVMLIGASTPALGLVAPESSDLDAIRAKIEGLEPTDSRLDLPQAFTLARNISDDPDRPTRRVLVIAASGRGLDRTREERAQQIRFDRVIAMSPATHTVPNIGIAHASPTRSLVTQSGLTLPMGVRVELIRSGHQGQSVSTSTVEVLDTEGRTIGQSSVRWETGQREAHALIAIDPSTLIAMGARTALIKVKIDDDANTRDNTRLIALPTRSTIRVGVIDRVARGAGTIAPSRWVRSALAPSEEFGISIVEIQAERASTMIAANLDALIVLAPSALDQGAWKRIADLNEAGALVLITQDAGSGSIEWLDRLDALSPGLLSKGSVLIEHERAIGFSTNQPEHESSLLYGIASEFNQLARAVSISRSVRISSTIPGSTLMVLDDGSADGSALALQSSPTDEQGLVVVFACAFDLEWTNLPARAMFVALMQEIVRQGVGAGSSMPTIEAGERINTPAWVISSHRVSLNNHSVYSKTNAHAGLVAQLDAQGVTRGYVVINPNTLGADTNPTTLEAFEEAILSSVDVDTIDWISPDTLLDDSQVGSGLLESTPPSVSVALWFLMGAGIIALIECVLARLFSSKLFEIQSVEARGARA